jgi:hypothetical protein
MDPLPMRDPAKAKSHARAYDEASVYSLDNPYMTTPQKAVVEAVVQTPIGAFSYTLLGYLAFVQPPNYMKAFLLAALVNVVVGLGLWFAARPRLAQLGLLLPVGFLFAGRASSVINLLFAGYLGYHRDWIGVAIGVVSAFGLSSLITPSTYLYSAFSHRMHPKYLLGKKIFGLTFPFEQLIST